MLKKSLSDKDYLPPTPKTLKIRMESQKQNQVGRQEHCTNIYDVHIKKNRTNWYTDVGIRKGESLVSVKSTGIISIYNIPNVLC